MTTATAHPAPSATIPELLSLLKPRVMTLVVFTGAIGMWLAPGTLHPYLQLLTIFAIALGSGAGGMLNMWYDRDIDAVMTRTAHRPIPTGRVAADDALVIGIMLAVASVCLLGLATNWFAAGILAFAIFFYAVIYTMWLKRRTPYNIVIGGAAGAFPPIIGWAAVTGSLSVEPFILFMIIFLWTPPHFWALALFALEDYRRAGVPMLPVTDGAQATIRQIVIYSWLLVAASLLPTFIGMSGLLHASGTILLGAIFLYRAHCLHRAPQEKSHATRLFLYSILYLFILFGLLLADQWVSIHILPAFA